jgi:hypothetical protein
VKICGCSLIGAVEVLGVSSVVDGRIVVGSETSIGVAKLVVSSVVASVVTSVASSIVDEKSVVDSEASVVVKELAVSSVDDGRILLDSETSIVIEESDVSLFVDDSLALVSENSNAVETLSVLDVVGEVPSAEDESRETVEEISLSGRVCVVSVEDTIEVVVEAASNTELVAPQELSVRVWLDSGLQGPAAASWIPMAKPRRAVDTFEKYMVV